MFAIKIKPITFISYPRSGEFPKIVSPEKDRIRFGGIVYVNQCYKYLSTT